MLDIDLRRFEELMIKFNQTCFSDLSNLSDDELAGSVIIGFDIDWASDFILEDTLQLASELGVRPTLFLTHNSALIRNLFSEGQYEFGLHPNFERLLNGDSGNGLDAPDVLQRLMHEFPGVDVVRSHSLTTSSRLKALFKRNKFSIESSFITHGTNNIFPNFWYESSGMLHVPITWEDDVWFTLEEGETNGNASKILRFDKLNVLTFHPIHLYLNTTDVAHYNASREFINNPDELSKRRKNGEFGVRTIFSNIANKLRGERL